MLCMVESGRNWVWYMWVGVKEIFVSEKKKSEKLEVCLGKG